MLVAPYCKKIIRVTLKPNLVAADLPLILVYKSDALFYCIALEYSQKIQQNQVDTFNIYHWINIGLKLLRLERKCKFTLKVVAA